jgi:Uma2 family endonuclease
MPSPRELYTELMALPEWLIGEIVDGSLHTSRLLPFREAVVHSRLLSSIGSVYDKHVGGEWLILSRMQTEVGNDVLVPDIAGWRESHVADQDDYVRVAPEWVCEVLSPEAAAWKRSKLSTYARHGVTSVWLVDAQRRVVETFALQRNELTLSGMYADSDILRAEPFPQDINLAEVWPPRAST